MTVSSELRVTQTVPVKSSRVLKQTKTNEYGKDICKAEGGMGNVFYTCMKLSKNKVY